MLVAVSDELREARSARTSTLRVSHGRLVHSSSDRFLYQFETDVSAAPLPAESPVLLRIEGRDSVHGTLVLVEEFRLMLEVGEDLGPIVAQAHVSAEPWFILEALADRLRRLQAPNSEGTDAPWRNPAVAAGLLAGEVQDREAPLDEGGSPRLNYEQRSAVSRCTNSLLHFVWGPPGTGKTATLAETARSLAMRGERVLVLSHSNVAVDVAISRIADFAAGTGLVRDGKVLRIGTPQQPEVASRQEILPEGVLKRRWPDLFAERDRLRQERRDLGKGFHARSDDAGHAELAARLSSVRAALQELEKKIRELSNELVQGALILAATLSRLFIDDAIWAWKADAIVVDEVSMAAFAQVFAAASRAKRRVLLFGDARQLPPILLADSPPAHRWLGRDAFVVAGVVGAGESLGSDPRVSFLPKQYRMGKRIASLVSRLAYGGRLDTPDEVSLRARDISSLSPAPGAELVFVDSSPLHSACAIETRRGSYSRVNPLHVAIAATLAGRLRAGGCRDVSVISPYGAQAALESRAMRRGIEQGAVRSATVHRFQGNESDAVIVDLADARPQRGASHITGRNEDTSLRLLNVALSRARGKLIVLMDSRFVLERHPRSSPARRAWALGSEAPRVEATWNLLRELGDGTDVAWHESWHAVQSAVAQDVARASTTLFAHLPTGFGSTPQLVDAVAAAGDAVETAVLFAPHEVAASFEKTSAELRLLPRNCGLVVISAPVAAWVGGSSPDAPVARIAGAGFCEALQGAVFGDALLLPGPSAESEERLDRACGRCSDCGEPRRPRHESARGWMLRCGTKGHATVALDSADLTTSARAAGASCPECGGPPVAHDARGSPFLGCENYSSGCEGRPPRLEDLFPS